MSNGIEVHYDSKRQHLGLACGPDAFAAYREIARQHLADFPEINADQVVEINIVNTTTFSQRRGLPHRQFWIIVLGAILILTLTLAIIGAVSLVSHF